MTTIDHVIAELESIIQDSIVRNNPLGYFAALYQQVTIKVKEGIANHLFEDGKRMEKLDIIFAKRYIDAYKSWQNNQPISKSWEKAFIHTEIREPIVLQHLLMGMNAHINLDLGIAAAEISEDFNISDLQNDFNKINEILSAQVNNIQNKLVSIWPFLGKILEKTGLIDDLIVDFSMELARNGAWKFATAIAQLSRSEKISQIKIRDSKVAEKSKIITSPGFGAKTVLWIIRLGEKGTVAQKIDTLRHKL
jgi:hypothetical protein